MVNLFVHYSRETMYIFEYFSYNFKNKLVFIDEYLYTIPERLCTYHVNISVVILKTN